MALTFPTYFPQAFLGPVVKAAATAEREFRADGKVVSLGDAASSKRAATKYIMTVALAFAHQACEAARARDPHVAMSRIAWYVEDFLRRLSAHFYHELVGPDMSRRWGSWEGFEREIQSAVMESPGWADHLTERAAIVDASGELSGETDIQGPIAVDPITTSDGVRAVGVGIVLPLPSNASHEQKRAAVQAYLDKVEAVIGKRLPQAAIWRAAHYKTRTEFERWLRNDRRATKAADKAFRRILAEKPHLNTVERN